MACQYKLTTYDPLTLPVARLIATLLQCAIGGCTRLSPWFANRSGMLAGPTGGWGAEDDAEAYGGGSDEGSSRSTLSFNISSALCTWLPSGVPCSFVTIIRNEVAECVDATREGVTKQQGR